MLPYPTPPSGGGLYVIRLSDTHYYGGRTITFQGRWAYHYRALIEGRHSNAHFQSVFNQHKRFEPEVLSALLPQEQKAAEQEWLDKNFGKPGCVNLSGSSEGVHAGYKHSEETCAKHRRPIHTPESREKCSRAAKKPRVNYTPHAHTDESRQKLALATKSQHEKETLLGVVRTSFRGRTHTEESRKKMSDAKLGVPHLAPRERGPRPESVKQNQAEKMRLWWANLSPEEKQAMSEKHQGKPPTKGMTGRKHSPETLLKMSASAKNRARKSAEDS